MLLKLLFRAPPKNGYIHYLVIPPEYFSFARFGISLKIWANFTIVTRKLKSFFISSFYTAAIPVSTCSAVPCHCPVICTSLSYSVFISLEVVCNFNDGMTWFFNSLLGGFLFFSTMCMNCLFIRFDCLPWIFLSQFCPNQEHHIIKKYIFYNFWYTLSKAKSIIHSDNWKHFPTDAVFSSAFDQTWP